MTIQNSIQLRFHVPPTTSRWELSLLYVQKKCVVIAVAEASAVITRNWAGTVVCFQRVADTKSKPNEKLNSQTLNSIKSCSE